MTHWLLENRRFVVFLLLLGVFRTAVADWNPIPSASMRPTLLEGDVVFVNRLAYDIKLPLSNVVVTHLADPARGDIVTFSSPKDGMRLIKRIAGVPGDTVEMRDNRLTINGEPITYSPIGRVRESWGDHRTVAAERARETFGNAAHTVQWFTDAPSPRASFGPITIPRDRFLMLGDNRDDSADSRYIGLVPREALIGKAEGVLVSADIMDRWQLRLGRFASRLY